MLELLFYFKDHFKIEFHFGRRWNTWAVDQPAFRARSTITTTIQSATERMAFTARRRLKRRPPCPTRKPLCWPSWKKPIGKHFDGKQTPLAVVFFWGCNELSSTLFSHTFFSLVTRFVAVVAVVSEGTETTPPSFTLRLCEREGSYRSHWTSLRVFTYFSNEEQWREISRNEGMMTVENRTEKDIIKYDLNEVAWIVSLLLLYSLLLAHKKILEG